MTGPAWGKTLSKDKVVHRLKVKGVKVREWGTRTQCHWMPRVFILVHVKCLHSALTLNIGPSLSPRNGIRASLSICKWVSALDRRHKSYSQAES